MPPDQLRVPGRTVPAVSEPRLTARPLLITFGSILEPDGGLQVRSRILAESLAKLGMPPVVISTRESASRRSLPAWARSIHAPTRKPKRGFSWELARMIRQAAADCDVVFMANAMFMPVLTVSGVRLPMVWDTNECQTLHYERLPRTTSNLTKKLIWLVLERWAARRCSIAVAISEAEAVEWRRIHPHLRGKVMTVDHTAFASTDRTGDGSRAVLQSRLRRPAKGPVLVFVGTMTAKHNAAAARWTIDVLTPSLPATTTVVLCGPGSQHLHGGNRGAKLAFLGEVDDVDSIIAAADLCLAPLASGAGVKTKVLHYLAHGRRVAGTPVAFEGLEGAPGLFAASLDALPALVARLSSDAEPHEIAERRSTAQRKWLEQHHGRRHIAEQWSAVLRSLRPR